MLLGPLLVAQELGTNTLETGITVGLHLLDPVAVSLLILIVVSVILGLGHLIRERER